jgi:hypothetical protein
MEELLKKYDITIPQIIVLGRAEEWTYAEMHDLEYMEERMIANKDVFIK